MPFVSLLPGLSMLALGPVNVFLLADGPHFTLIDTGYEQSAPTILNELRALGHPPTAITNILLTHCHPDHAGGLAAIQQASGAQVWMHPIDAAVVRGEQPMVRSKVAPGLLNRLLYRLFIANVPPHVPPAPVHHQPTDGDLLPMAGGIRVIHTPGHSMGHLAFLVERDNALIVGDVCSNITGLAYSIVYDDLAEGRRSLAKLAALTPGLIGFGHGKPLRGNATARFRQKWR